MEISKKGLQKLGKELRSVDGLNKKTEIKNLESEIEKLKDPYNQSGLSEVDTQKINQTQNEIDKKLPDVAIIDVKLDKGDNDGIELLSHIKKKIKISQL